MVVLSLQRHARVVVEEPGIVAIHHPSGTTRLTELDSGVQEALACLGRGPVSRARLMETATAASSAADLEGLGRVLGRLTKLCLVHYSVVVAGKEVIVLAATSSLADFTFHPPPADASLQLSRFAHMRRVEEDLVVESPPSFARATLRTPELGFLVAALVRACTPRELCRLLPGWDQDSVYECVGLLAGAGMVGVLDEEGRLAEDEDSDLVQREWHDVVMHFGSRGGLTDQPFGGVFPFVRTISPTPAVKTSLSAGSLPLPRPDLESLVRTDVPLQEVMEKRRSIRDYNERRITMSELGEFLFRIARVRAIYPIDVENGNWYEKTDRTYPSGGRAYDLEIYLTIRSCQGVPAGVYHYQPVEHALSLVSERPELVIGMLNGAYVACGRVAVPQVLITLASRFSRLTWKYRAMAYATTLKNVGVLYEAMYLAATAMGLAPCGLGAGNAALFSEITGLDPLVESSVGEFMLSTLPDDER